MSLCIVGGVVVGCWALLSLIGGEKLRQEKQIEAERDARKKAVEEAENAAA